VGLLLPLASPRSHTQSFGDFEEFQGMVPMAIEVLERMMTVVVVEMMVGWLTAVRLS